MTAGNRRAAVSFRNRMFWIGLAALLGGLSYVAGLPYFPWFNLVALCLALYILIPFHELAHLLAAWATGTRVKEVRYGTGALVREGHLGTVRLALYRYPTAAGCLVADAHANGRRWRAAVVAAAGPLFNLLLCVALLPGFQPGQLVTSLALSGAMFLASLVHLLAGFAHWRTGSGELPGPSDVGRVWLAIRGRT